MKPAEPTSDQSSLIGELRALSGQDMSDADAASASRALCGFIALLSKIDGAGAEGDGEHARHRD